MIKIALTGKRVIGLFVLISFLTAFITILALPENCFIYNSPVAVPKSGTTDSHIYLHG